MFTLRSRCQGASRWPCWRIFSPVRCTWLRSQRPIRWEMGRSRRLQKWPCVTDTPPEHTAPPTPQVLYSAPSIGHFTLRPKIHDLTCYHVKFHIDLTMQVLASSLIPCLCFTHSVFWWFLSPGSEVNDRYSSGCVYRFNLHYHLHPHTGLQEQNQVRESIAL